MSRNFFEDLNDLEGQPSLPRAQVLSGILNSPTNQQSSLLEGQPSSPRAQVLSGILNSPTNQQSSLLEGQPSSPRAQVFPGIFNSPTNQQSLSPETLFSKGASNFTDAKKSFIADEFSVENLSDFGKEQGEVSIANLLLPNEISPKEKETSPSLSELDFLPTVEEQKTIQEIEQPIITATKTLAKPPKIRYDKNLRITDLNSLVAELKDNNPDVEFIQQVDLSRNVGRDIAKKLKQEEQKLNWPTPDFSQSQPYAFIGEDAKKNKIVDIIIPAKSNYFITNDDKPSTDLYSAFGLFENLERKITQDGNMVTIEWKGKNPVVVDVRDFGEFLKENNVDVQSPKPSPEAKQAPKRRKTLQKSSELPTEEPSKVDTSTADTSTKRTNTNASISTFVPASSAEVTGPGDYERLRAANIRRNQAFLKSIGLESAPPARKETTKKDRKSSTKRDDDDEDGDEDYVEKSKDNESDESEDEESDSPKERKPREPKQTRQQREKKSETERKSKPTSNAEPSVVVDDSVKQRIAQFLGLDNRPTLRFHALAGAISAIPRGTSVAATMPTSAQLAAASSSQARPTRASTTTISGDVSNSTAQTSRPTEAAKTVEPETRSTAQRSTTPKQKNNQQIHSRIQEIAQSYGIELEDANGNPKSPRQLITETADIQNKLRFKQTGRGFERF